VRSNLNVFLCTSVQPVSQQAHHCVVDLHLCVISSDEVVPASQ